MAWRRGFTCLSPGSLFPGDWAGKIPGSLTQPFLRMPKLRQLNPSLGGWLMKQPSKLSWLKIPSTGNPAPCISCKGLFAISPKEHKQLLGQISSPLAPTACPSPCCAAPTHHQSLQKPHTCTTLELGQSCVSCTESPSNSCSTQK